MRSRVESPADSLPLPSHWQDLEMTLQREVLPQTESPERSQCIYR